ncbi:MAG: zinc ribbon domain-containing protein [Anaerolineae bacterium]|nr:zinc ribbon domain-containing protein [Anaerolineae bacterium]
MAKKTLGYVELEWTCPSCSMRNPGSIRTCRSCGAAMPEGVEFELPVQQELDTSEETAQRVAAGPDILCPYCGTRNRADASTCTQCGGDLSAGTRRESGQVLGAYDASAKPALICPHCGAENPATAFTCSQCGGSLARPEVPEPAQEIATAPKRRLLPVILILLALFACVAGLLLLTRGSGETVAEVEDVRWTYSIALEQLVPVTREGWRDQVPAEARALECTQRVRQIVDEPVAGAREVCRTPYVVDTGTGQGQVVQDCQYHVSDDWCRYTVLVWQMVPGPQLSGSDLRPQWPPLSLARDQRAEARSENYTVILNDDGQRYTYEPRTLSEFQRFTPGSRWKITTNALGGVISVESAD